LRPPPAVPIAELLRDHWRATLAGTFGVIACGAMEALRDTQMPDGRQLVDEVDVISSVSGGSFALRDIEQAFLSSSQQPGMRTALVP